MPNIRDLNYSSGATKTLIEDAKALTAFRPKIDRYGYGYSICLTKIEENVDFLVYLHNPSSGAYRTKLRQQLTKILHRKVHFIGEPLSGEIPEEVKTKFKENNNG